MKWGGGTQPPSRERQTLASDARLTVGVLGVYGMKGEYQSVSVRDFTPEGSPCALGVFLLS